uniref:protein-glutamine gamma-glutamyltransferase n=1 Tax=Monopterus albus TaxID=43700 RepID=A0A3Q3IJQ2_MONAL
MWDSRFTGKDQTTATNTSTVLSPCTPASGDTITCNAAERSVTVFENIGEHKHTQSQAHVYLPTKLETHSHSTAEAPVSLRPNESAETGPPSALHHFQSCHPDPDSLESSQCARTVQFSEKPCTPCMRRRQGGKVIRGHEPRCRYRESYQAAIENPVTFGQEKERGNMLAVVEEDGDFSQCDDRRWPPGPEVGNPQCDVQDQQESLSYARLSSLSTMVVDTSERCEVVIVDGQNVRRKENTDSSAEIPQLHVVKCKNSTAFGLVSPKINRRKMWKFSQTENSILDIPSSFLFLTPSGGRDRTGRAITELYGDHQGWRSDVMSWELFQMLLYFHSITRREIRDAGMTLIFDARKTNPQPHALSKSTSCPTAHEIRIPLFKLVEVSQLSPRLDGTLSHSQCDWVELHQKLFPFVSDLHEVSGLLLRAVSKLEEPQRTDTCIMDQRTFMRDVLEDSRLVSLQREGGSILARLRKELDSVTSLYSHVEEQAHMLVQRSNMSLEHLEYLLQLREMEGHFTQVLYNSSSQLPALLQFTYNPGPSTASVGQSLIHAIRGSGPVTTSVSLSANDSSILKTFQDRLLQFSPERFQEMKAQASVLRGSRAKRVWNVAWLRCQEARQQLQERMQDVHEVYHQHPDSNSWCECPYVDVVSTNVQTASPGGQSLVVQSTPGSWHPQWEGVEDFWKRRPILSNNSTDLTNVACCNIVKPEDHSDAGINQGSKVIPPSPHRQMSRARTERDAAALSQSHTVGCQWFPWGRGLRLRSVSQDSCLTGVATAGSSPNPEQQVRPPSTCSHHGQPSCRILHEAQKFQISRHGSFCSEDTCMSDRCAAGGNGAYCKHSSLPVGRYEGVFCLANPQESTSNARLQRVLEELVLTEREYVRSLGYILTHYLPLLDRPDIPQDLRGKRGVIFGNLEKLYDFHSHYFLPELEACQGEPAMVARCFLRHSESFGLYALYSKNKPQSDALILHRRHDIFKKKQQELEDMMDLSSYLLRPIQRISKYSLLLQDMLTLAGSHRAEIQAAADLVRFQMRHGNDLLTMDAIQDCDVNLKEQGQLIRQDEFTVYFRKKKCVRRIFLFEDLILFSKTKRTDVGNDVYVYKQSFKFEPGILDICLKILDENPKFVSDADKDCSARRNPIYVTRVLSAMINSNNDSGVLVGKWGEVSEGVHPGKWVGSGAILRQWAKSGPVRYGQCWVFAAVACTVSRALGIPCRVVTNFRSAHDTDANLVIENLYGEDGERISNDSIWNFHVWVDSWMTRPDLGPEFDGWQTSDPTPQETSDGVFCCGPASLRAIRKGELTKKYDAPFIFAEVNADVVDLVRMSDGQIVKFSGSTKSVGRCISTKAVGSDERHDITHQYKYPEGSKKERQVYEKAQHHNKLQQQGEEPGFHLKVLFIIKLADNMIMGSDFEVCAVLTNNSTETRTCTFLFNTRAVSYNGSQGQSCGFASDKVEVPPGKQRLLNLRLEYDSYGSVITSDRLIQLSAITIDKQTNQYHKAEKTIVLDEPDIKIKLTGEAVVNQPVTAELTLLNPLPEPLQDCSFTIQGVGKTAKYVNYISAVMTVGPKQEAKARLEFTPTAAGSSVLLVNFDSDKVRNIKSFINVVVKE